jgi:hypothetical protein
MNEAGTAGTGWRAVRDWGIPNGEAVVYAAGPLWFW